jgi:hypothetical protein
MDLKAAGTKRKIQIAELEERREKAYHSAKLNYTRKEPSDGTTSGSKSSISIQEIRYFSLTLTFIYLIMVSFIVSGKTRI